MPLPTTAFYPERIESSDDAYAAIGRALTLATRFEANCRSLALYIGVRTTKGGGQELEDCSKDDWEKLMRRLTGGNFSRQIDKIAKKLELTSDYRTVLHEARVARNCITHELTIGLSDPYDPADQEFLVRLKELTTIVARADFYVAVFIDKLSGDPVPSGRFIKVINEYIDRMVAWVCEVD